MVRLTIKKVNWTILFYDTVAGLVYLNLMRQSCDTFNRTFRIRDFISTKMCYPNATIMMYEPKLMRFCQTGGLDVEPPSSPNLTLPDFLMWILKR